MYLYHLNVVEGTVIKCGIGYSNKQINEIFLKNVSLSLTHLVLGLQVSSWLQESISLVPIHQDVQLRWVGTTLFTASPNAPKQYVHADTNGYHHGDGLWPSWGWWPSWWWLWEEVTAIWQEEKLCHISPHRNHWFEWWPSADAKWRNSQLLKLRNSVECCSCRLIHTDIYMSEMFHRYETLYIKGAYMFDKWMHDAADVKKHSQKKIFILFYLLELMWISPTV